MSPENKRMRDLGASRRGLEVLERVVVAQPALDRLRRGEEEQKKVFKNQAATAPKQQKRWVNDAVRSDFHRKFLSKYIV